MIFSKFVFNEIKQHLLFHKNTISDISIKLSKEEFLSEEFQDLIQIINSLPLMRVSLTFNDEAPSKEELLAIADKANFALHLTVENNKDFVPPSDVRNLLIQNIRKRLEKKLPPQENILSSDDSRLSKPIHLKATSLNRQQLKSKDLPVEIQVVEELEQVQEIQAEAELEIEENQEQVETYRDAKVDFSEFCTRKPFIKARLDNDDLVETLFSTLRQELFANLPEAIKYLTPAAAEYLAHHLPEFVSLNKENLPEGFSLKKTDKGEFVLDYNELSSFDHEPDFFTPEKRELNFRLLFDVSLSELPDIKALAHNQNLYQAFLQVNSSEKMKERMINLWVQYGEKGIQDFFGLFKGLHATNPELLDFLIKEYVSFFPQWDAFVSSPTFAQALSTIKAYQEPKLSCFKRFLEGRGPSLHDLEKTVSAFESFWQKVESLCRQNDVNIDHVINGWSLPKGGNPIVYMERLLFILENAKDLKDQLEVFNQAQETLSLENFGAYYASRYEGYKIVSTKMVFDYNPTQQDLAYFDPNTEAYSADLQKFLAIEDFLKFYELGSIPSYYWLVQDGTNLGENIDNLIAQGKIRPLSSIEIGEVLPLKEGFSIYENKDGRFNLVARENEISYEYSRAIIFRFLAKQNAGMPLSRFAAEIGSCRTAKQLFIALMSCSHPFFINETKLIQNLVEELVMDWNTDILSSFPDILDIIYDLYKKGVYFNQKEMRHLVHALYGQLELKTKNKHVPDFISSLKNNPLSIKLLIQDLDKKGFKQGVTTYLSVTTEIVEFLAEELLIKEFLGKDLFLFSYLITPWGTYHEESLEKQNLEKIKAHLLKASKLSKPNNFYHSIELLIYACESISSSTLVELFNILDNLDKYDENEVVTALLKVGYTKAKKLTEADIEKLLAPFFSEDFSFLIPSIQKMPDFSTTNISMIKFQAENLASKFRAMMKNPDFNLQEFFTRAEPNISAISYVGLHEILDFFASITHGNYSKLLNLILLNPQNHSLLEQVKIYRQAYLPLHFIERLAELMVASPHFDNKQGLEHLNSQIRLLFNQDQADPILKFGLSSQGPSLPILMSLMDITAPLSVNRQELAIILKHVHKKQQLSPFLDALKQTHNQAEILNILIKAASFTSKKEQNTFDFCTLINKLKSLDDEKIKHLSRFMDNSALSLNALSEGLNKLEVNDVNFEHLLNMLEKEPFGKRVIAEQFSTQEVERIVNSLFDMLNGTPYPYNYRKQMTEALLFVNEIGHRLAIYNNKPINALSSEELRALFKVLKNGKIKDPITKRFLALALMREAMYRSTGKWANSTQILALIDGMMHQGDFISNIDTGQGKSLIDVLKASLLYLESDRVDITTSSLIDAKRDVIEFRTYFNLLDIPFSKTPIHARSKAEDYQKEGINFSTFSSLSLFFARMRIEGNTVADAIDSQSKASLVINESDNALLDDHVTYRLSTTKKGSIGKGQEWIYYAINDFVANKDYLNNQQTAFDDIRDLKLFLRKQAKQLGHSPKLIDKLSNEQYLLWLEAAIIVNYHLKENQDYVISDYGEKSINGEMRKIRAAKILLLDGKVSAESQYGKGIQQFLHAYLNKAHDQLAKPESLRDFVIEPETDTVLSSNNKNLVDYYRSKKGYIWGSSGTVGSSLEIEEQYKKFGFEFSKIESHQAKNLDPTEIIIEKNQQAQWDLLYKKLLNLQSKGKEENRSPALIFCKDIDTAKAFYAFLKQKDLSQLQLYTGLGDEAEVISTAAKPGMFTITTSALGRNTHISYQKKPGLHVFHTSIDTTRASLQKSGRTGRQGSEGGVHFILNHEDLGDKNIETIQEELDKVARKERLENETFFDLMGYLFNQFIGLPKEDFIKGKATFLKDIWSKFSHEAEMQFRENKEANFTSFRDKLVEQFNDMMSTHLNSNSAFTKVDSIKLEKEDIKQSERYQPYSKPVKLKDCVAPSHLAFHLMQFEPPLDQDEDQLEENIKEKLQAIFAKIKAGKQVESQLAKYLDYLILHKPSKELIVKIHKNFLSQVLSTAKENSSLVERWRGYHSQLGELADSDQYLIFFQALAIVPVEAKQELEFDVVKNSIKALLEEYKARAWFISSQRKEFVDNCLERLESATDMKEITSILSKEKINTVEADEDVNKKQRFRLHFFGHSRYQETLSRALKLSMAIHYNTTTAPSISESLQKITPVELNNKNLAADNLKKIISNGRGHKKVAAQVVDDILGQEAKRNSFFKQKNKASVDEKDSEKQEKPKL